MRTMLVDVAAVNVRKRTAMLQDGTMFRLTELLDRDGDNTEDPDQAVAAIGKLPDGSWVAINLGEFVRTPSH